MPAPVISLSEAERTAWDVLVVGAGHNGLVAALCLARQGLKVLAVEGKSVVGGAVRTERPFARAPNLSTSTGAYLLGLMQPELLALLGLELPLVRRDPHYFLPTMGSRYLLFGSDRGELERQFRRFFSEQDYRAQQALEREIAALRDDIAPTWLEEPLTIEETAERYVRPELRSIFVRLCRGSVGDYLERFGFESDLIKAMYAVTDGFSGLFGTWDSPGTGMNFLIHNMCRLPGSDGTRMILTGGMGTLTQMLATELGRAGGHVLLDEPVSQIVVEQGSARGVLLERGAELRARIVIANCDPFTLRDLVGPERFSPAFNQRIDGYKRPGSTFKLNLALEKLPTFTCLPQDVGQFGPTIHLLPEESQVLAELGRAFEAVRAGKLPEFPPIEWYMHSTVDPTLSDEKGRISSALFVQWVPYELAESDWDTEAERYADHLLSICDRFAPGTSSLVVDRMALSPKHIERYFGMRHGHIHHVDNAFGFADRFPHKTPIAGLYSASAGTHPAGSVIGSAGYIAAQRVLRDRRDQPAD
ncbi:MAG TPA: NAD(P)/FAD-dependent oxidoreductase [Polyangiaceae bacterium]|nr:NAD(P)/FAD-dependent oxidoreductase [Polyangiaceae bacterium]